VIYELAEFTIPPGQGADFEQAMLEARNVISQAPGFISIEYLRGVERPDVYRLLVKWETLDDHLRGFRESDLFPRWRAIVGPFFASDPLVEHGEPVDDPFTGTS
jgi:heme-degrading monooxygenase HmoA